MAAESYIAILPYLKGKSGGRIIERFHEKIDRRGEDECWPWIRSKTTSGYGRFKIGSYVCVHANRVALVIASGDDHLRLQALHSCDNPPCCNPAHLRWGTEADNSQDKKDRGRVRSGDQAGLNNGACKLRPGDLETIVRRLQDGYPVRNAAAGLPVTESMVSRIRTGRSWVRQASALGWVPQISDDPRRGRTRADYAANGRDQRKSA